MSISDAWTNATPSSTARMNKVTIPSLTGDEIDALDISKHRVVFCTEDSTGEEFLKDHTYTVNADEDGWVDITAVSNHYHRNQNDGGFYIDMLSFNYTVTDLFLSRVTDLQKANWIQTVTGTGSIEDATDGTTGERSIRLRPNGTSGSGSTISYPHLSLDFSKSSFFEAKVRIETATSLAYHGGVNADFITAADSNTIKYQAEICTTTNNNWHLRTANGSANSSSDTGIAISTSRTYYFIEHLPDSVECSIYIDTNDAFQKTTNIPITGLSAHNNLIKHSIKNSTAADRPIHIYPTRIRYNVSETWA